MASVKEVLSRKKLPKDYPPSMVDVKTRDKHVPESVEYNVKHIVDHGDNILEQLKKEHQTNPEKAHQLAVKACEKVLGVYDEIEKFKKGKCKECRNG